MYIQLKQYKQLQAGQTKHKIKNKEINETSRNKNSHKQTAMR
jgi:hypothetical protein